MNDGWTHCIVLFVDDVKNMSKERLSSFKEYLHHFIVSEKALHQNAAEQLERLEGLVSQIDPDGDTETFVEGKMEEEEASDPEQKEDEVSSEENGNEKHESMQKMNLPQKRRSQRYSLSRELSQVDPSLISRCMLDLMWCLFECSWAPRECIPI